MIILGLKSEWPTFFTNLTGQDYVEYNNCFLWYWNNFLGFLGHRYVYYLYNFTHNNWQVCHRTKLCQKKAVSQKTSLMTGQLFSWLSSFFHRFYPIKAKWRPGLNNYNFQCALGNIRSHCKPKNDTKVYL